MFNFYLNNLLFLFLCLNVFCLMGYVLRIFFIILIINIKIEIDNRFERMMINIE